MQLKQHEKMYKNPYTLKFNSEKKKKKTRKRAKKPCKPSNIERTFQQLLNNYDLIDKSATRI